MWKMRERVVSKELNIESTRSSTNVTSVMEDNVNLFMKSFNLWSNIFRCVND